MTGARETSIQWVQEPRDQGEIMRQYTKLDHRLEHQDNPGLMVSRLLRLKPYVGPNVGPPTEVGTGPIRSSSLLVSYY